MVEPRGLGGGSSGAGSFDKETLAAEVADLLGRLHVREFAVIGHDWGGTIGFLLAADLRSRVRALVVEEELLPGSSVMIPEPGRSHYPTWHGPFNRAPGLAEVMVPDREDAYYGTFLRQSAGPVPLEGDAERQYVQAYRASSCLAASIGYYRTPEADARSVESRARSPIDVPVLTVGGRFGMGTAVAECFATVARDVTHQQMDAAGHYPVEQQPEIANASIVSFLLHHLGTS